MANISQRETCHVRPPKHWPRNCALASYSGVNQWTRIVNRKLRKCLPHFASFCPRKNEFGHGKKLTGGESLDTSKAQQFHKSAMSATQVASKILMTSTWPDQDCVTFFQWECSTARPNCFTQQSMFIILSQQFSPHFSGVSHFAGAIWCLWTQPREAASVCHSRSSWGFAQSPTSSP